MHDNCAGGRKLDGTKCEGNGDVIKHKHIEMTLAQCDEAERRRAARRRLRRRRHPARAVEADADAGRDAGRGSSLPREPLRPGVLGAAITGAGSGALGGVATRGVSNVMVVDTPFFEGSTAGQVAVDDGSLERSALVSPVSRTWSPPGAAPGVATAAGEVSSPRIRRSDPAALTSAEAREGVRQAQQR